MIINKLYSCFIALSVLLFFSACQKEEFTTTGMADDIFFLRSKGQDMPVHVSGNIDSKKLLFIIHGGPGGNSLEYQDAYMKSNIESQYAIIYWDQRYAGNSQGNGGSIDIDDFANDIKRIIYLVKNKYGEDQKIFLFAHSWGGFLAPYFLLQGNNQAEVQGWIQIGGAHNYVMNDSLTKEMLLFYGNQEITAGRNTSFWTEAVDWCNNNSYMGYENGSTLNGFAHDAETKFDFVKESDATAATSNNSSKIANRINGWISGILKIDQQAYQVPNSNNLFKITKPTLLLWGKYDFVCPSGLADDVEANIGSSDVSKFIFEKSGHSPMVDEPVEFWNQVTAWVSRH